MGHVRRSGRHPRASTASTSHETEGSERGWSSTRGAPSGSVVQAVGHEAAAEIDNLGLRAELARQVEEVIESRARLAGAHLEERQRIERDLHDGAQQRILAIALQLQSARVNGAADALRDEVDRAITHLALTVQELRDLAGGLQPAALAGGGLRAAIEDLANRIPLRIEVDVVDRRFPPNSRARPGSWSPRPWPTR